jgi:hypothetical protein
MARAPGCEAASMGIDFRPGQSESAAMAHGRHLLKSEKQSGLAPSDSKVARYKNRKGDTYYLHEGKTKTGKPRYFVAKTIGEGAIASLPPGFEFTESINGVVSVRRVDTSAPKISDIDLATAQAEMARHPHLRFHRVEAVKGEIVVFEPQGGFSPDRIAELARSLYTSPEFLEARLGDMPTRGRYQPVMKFVPGEEPGQYIVYRMTYRGDGGWSWPLGFGSLKKLVKQYLGHIGTEGFFELM